MSALPPIQTFEEFEAETLPILKPPFESKFGAVSWADMDTPGVQHRWLVKGLITENELAMIAGASQSGKSFLMIDLAMAIARGLPWFGRKVAQGGVIYQAGEDPTGIRRKRIPAYRRHMGLTPSDDVPFFLLTGSLNLWHADTAVDDFIEECRQLGARLSQPLKLVVIDTFAKASTGADENSVKEVGLVLAKCERIRDALGVAVILVDHMNGHGDKVRGVTSKTANIDSILVCRMATVEAQKRGDTTLALDADERKIREITNDLKFGGKIKNGEALAKPLRFVLRSVEIGRDEDGDPVTSCVLAPPAGEDLAPREGGRHKPISVKLSLALKALKEAIDARGRKAPDTVPNAPAGQVCVTLADWRDCFAPMLSEEGEDPDDLKERTRDHLRKTAVPPLIDRNYIRKHGDWVWRTTRRVPGLDAPDPRPEPPRDGPDPLAGLDVPW